MKKLIASVATGLTLTIGAAAAASASSPGGKNVLDLTARQTQAAEVPAPAGFLGTRFVGADEVYEGSRPVGRAARSCEVVATAPDNSATFQCLVTIALPEGTITLQAMPTLTEQGLEDVQGAVTGGTGGYKHARGEAQLKELSPTETRYTIDLR